MIKKIGLLFLIVIIVGFSGFVGYNLGNTSRENQASLPKTLPGLTIPAELQNSRVVEDMRMDVMGRAVLKGKLVEVSVPDRSVVIKSGEDSLTVYFGDNAMIQPKPTAMGFFPPPEDGSWKLDMEKVKSHLGESVTVVLTLESADGEEFKVSGFLIAFFDMEFEMRS